MKIDLLDSGDSTVKHLLSQNLERHAYNLIQTIWADQHTMDPYFVDRKVDLQHLLDLMKLDGEKEVFAFKDDKPESISREPIKQLDHFHQEVEKDWPEREVVTVEWSVWMPVQKRVGWKPNADHCLSGQDLPPFYAEKMGK